MEFLNGHVDTDVLPRAEDVPLKPIEKDYLKVLRLEWLVTITVLLIGCILLVLFVKPLQRPVWIILIGAGWILLSALYYIFQSRSFFIKAYALRDKDVIFRTGWIIQRFHTCPFNRVQHSIVTSGPFERKYKLATLVLYTAGSESADLRIPGLTESTAYQVKEWITQKIINEQPAEADQ